MQYRQRIAIYQIEISIKRKNNNEVLRIDQITTRFHKNVPEIMTVVVF